MKNPEKNAKKREERKLSKKYPHDKFCPAGSDGLPCECGATSKRQADRRQQLKLKPLPDVPALDRAQTLAIAKWYGLEKFPYENKLWAEIEMNHAMESASRWGAVLVARIVQAGRLRQCGDPLKALNRIIGGGVEPITMHFIPNYAYEALQTLCGRNVESGILAEGTTVVLEVTCRACLRLMEKKQ